MTTKAAIRASGSKLQEDFRERTDLMACSGLQWLLQGSGGGQYLYPASSRQLSVHLQGVETRFQVSLRSTPDSYGVHLHLFPLLPFSAIPAARSSLRFGKLHDVYDSELPRQCFCAVSFYSPNLSSVPVQATASKQVSW